MDVRRIVTALAACALVTCLAWWLPRQFPGPPPPSPHIQTMPDDVIVGLEIPLQTPQGISRLKAAYALPLGPGEMKVYGGFSYTTPNRRIEGEEAIIDLRTGSARAMKHIRIWEK